ncbi:MAG: MFS transporter [Nocardioidaceae bacterium]
MRTPALARDPAFRAYFAAQTVSAFGSAMAGLAATFAILRIGGSAAELGLVMAAGTLPGLALMLVGGVAGDRWERRRILLTCDLLMAATQATLAALLLTGHAQVWHFLVGELVSGASMAFSWPAGVGIFPTIVGRDQLQAANATMRMAGNVVAVVGPPVAGVLVAAASPGWALAADALSFVASAAFLVRLPRSAGVVQAGAALWADVRSGWREFSSRSWVWLMVMSFATYQATVLPAIYVLGPVLAVERLDGASSWALVLSARAVGAVLVGVLLLRWRPRRPLVASTAVVLLDVPFLASLAAGLPLPVVVATAALSSAGIVAADTVWESTFQANVPSDVLSRVSSYESLGSMAINPLGFALVGAAAAAMGAGPVIVIALLGQVVVRGALIASPAVRAVRRPEPVPVG